MSDIFKNVNWDAVGAIGQWAGAIFTALAVYFALKRDKPKIHIGSFVLDNSTVRIYVTNRGFFPISIFGFALLEPGFKRLWGAIHTVEKTINPAERLMVDFDLKIAYSYINYPKTTALRYFIVSTNHLASISTKL